MATIHQRTEGKRGCGFRKKGGKYLVSDGISKACGMLPIPLTVCPCCSAGIKQSRGFTWITGALLQGRTCPTGMLKLKGNQCHTCPLYYIKPEFKLGLMWVGAKYYPSIKDFDAEAVKMGVSKRISQVPNDFVVGKTWIALAHPEAIVKAEKSGLLTCTPGIFQIFKPTRIEYIVTGKETEDELDAMEKRGFTLVELTTEEGDEDRDNDDE